MHASRWIHAAVFAVLLTTTDLSWSQTASPPPSTDIGVVRPVVKETKLLSYECKAEDSSFTRISQQVYGTEKYGQALLEFNRKIQDPVTLKSGLKVHIPPIEYLEKNFASCIVSGVADKSPPREQAKALIPDGLTCKIYRLADLPDPAAGPWIAETIPQVIQPATWKTSGGEGVLSYYPAGRVLVISQTSTAHAEIDDFLKNLKTALPKTNNAAPRDAAFGKDRIVQAQFNQPSSNKNDPFALSNASSYPVPAPLTQPKHLFHLVFRFEGNGMDTALADLAKKVGVQVEGEADGKTAKADSGKASQMEALMHFIVRYEGEGIIDSNVVDFMKVYLKAMSEEKKAPTPAAPTPPLPTAPTGPLPVPAYGNSPDPFQAQPYQRVMPPASSPSPFPIVQPQSPTPPQYAPCPPSSAPVLGPARPFQPPAPIPQTSPAPPSSAPVPPGPASPSQPPTPTH